MLETISADRIRHELELVLEEEAPEKVIRRLDGLGALAELHPGLKGDAWLSRKFRQARESASPERPDAELYLALLAYRLTPGESEKLIIFIERDKESDKNKDRELADRISRKITESTGLVPESVIVLDPGSIPRTSSGKLRRGDTLKQYLAGKLSPPKQVTLFQIATEIVKSKIAVSRMGR